MKSLSLALFLLLSFASVAQEISMRYELVKMDKNINTSHHEAAPIVSPDGNTLYFFVQNHPENTYGRDDTQDIWVSRKDENGVWGPAEHLKSPFNIHHSNQVFTVLPGGDLFIKGGKRKGQKGFSIVTAGRDLQELEVTDFDKMNKGRFYGASMSADRKHIILYFSEVNNSTTSDLYVSHLQPNGKYSVPKKLKLSTNLDEVGPFIGPDQKTLFFSSARQAPGRQGGLDIYKSTRLDDTWENWSEPVNLGKPINTNALDFYFTMDNAGNIYTSRANKALEGAQLDLYMLVPKNIRIIVNGKVYHQETQGPLTSQVKILPKEKENLELKTDAAGKFNATIPEVPSFTVSAHVDGFVPQQLDFTIPLLYNDTTLTIEIPMSPVEKKLVISGNVFDRKTKQPIEARLDIYRRGGPEHVKAEAKGGKFEKRVEAPGWYMISASAEGYLNTTDSVLVNDATAVLAEKDIYLQPIEVGVTVRLKNIYFDFNKTTLKAESYEELNKVVDFLKQNPSVEIEIAGHTDNKGSDDYNLNLSQGRSQAVVDYIVSQGIEGHRLTARGYGESKPIDTNDTEEGRANNRRVEFTVLKK